jgi:tetraacyldisaccharide 4'-kinase
MSVLFVTNGHGESAIAERIARELRGRSGEETQHFPLVGGGFGVPGFIDVGPRAELPSGGLVAMGNIRNLVRDLRAGFIPLWLRQRAFLRRSAGRHAVIVAVGDVYALAMAYCARAPTIFVGTAKSEYVAPYGRLEHRVMRKAAVRFVRDEPTAAALRAAGLEARVGNVIVDLAFDAEPYIWPATPGERLVLLPGSREDAYANVLLLARVVRFVNRVRPLHAVLSIAPKLDPSRMAALLAGDGWKLEPGSGEEPFGLRDEEGSPVVKAWSGNFAALFPGATLVIGQAGTANEAAAACGLPVVALETERGGREGWYRMRQGRLLGPALQLVSGEPERAAASIVQLLDDPMRREAMSLTGKARMGPPGAAALIASAIEELLRRGSHHA